jgi:autotransporter-associated beta strand protein
MKSGVAKMDLGAGTVSLWVGATGATIDVSGTADASVSGLSLAGIQGIRINGYNGSASQSFDNLVIGTTIADVNAIDGPPPTPASGTWTNTAGGLWDTAGNWSGNIVATGSDSTANFNTLNIIADTTVNLDSARTIGNLVFGDTDTASAAGWTLANNAVAAHTLTLSGTTPTITVNALGATKTATISAAVAGTAGLAKSGTGTLTLSGGNLYSGATTVSNGILQVSGQPYFNVGRTTTIASGAVLELNNSNNTFNTLMPVSTINGAGTFRLSGDSTINQSNNGTVSDRLNFAMDAGGLIDLQGTSRLTNGGWKQMNWTSNNASMSIASGATFDIWDGQPVTIDALTGSGTVVKGHPDPNTFMLTVGVADGSGTFSGTIENTSGAGAIALTKTGSGSQTLSGTNTYSGSTIVEDGTLSIPSGGSLRFFPTTAGQTNSLSGTETATLSYLGTVDLDLSAANTTDGNLWTIVNVGSFSGPVPTLTPAAVTSTLGTFIETITGTWELTTISAKWTFDEAAGTLLYEVTGTDYEIWGGPYGLAAGSEGLDLDNDGVTNFEEYAFGLIPDSGASVNPITTLLDKAAGTFSYTRRTASGLAYSVWFSTDLVGWTEDTGVTEGTTTPNGDNETVPVTLSTLPGDPLPAKLFIQVRAN